LTSSKDLPPLNPHTMVIEGKRGIEQTLVQSLEKKETLKGRRVRKKEYPVKFSEEADGMVDKRRTSR